MIIVTCQLSAKAGKEKELKHELESMVAACSRHEGLLLYSLHQHAALQERFIFYEHWNSRTALELHAASPECQEYNARMRPYIENKRIDIWELLASVPE